MNSLTESPFRQNGVVSIAITRYCLFEGIDKERIANTYFHAIEYRAVDGSWICLTPEIEYNLQRIGIVTSHAVDFYSSGYQEINLGIGSRYWPGAKDNLFLGGVRVRDNKLQILICDCDAHGCRHFARLPDGFCFRDLRDNYVWWNASGSQELTVYRIKEIDLGLLSFDGPPYPKCCKEILYYERCTWADNLCKTHLRDKVKEKEIGLDSRNPVLENDTFSGGKYLEGLTSNLFLGRKIHIESKDYVQGKICPVRQEHEISEQFFKNLVDMVLS